MVKINTRAKILIVTLIIPFILIFCCLSLVKNHIRNTYSKIISNQEIMGAIESGRYTKVSQVLKNNGLDFQYVHGSRIVSQSNNSLPKPEIVFVETVSLKNVLQENSTDTLPYILPYVRNIDGKVYLISVLSAKLDSNEYYLVYSQLF